ncbi:DUF397 domain-containing protein [Streptomyces coeruleorubidus]|nr:DUF397 domain-containing protein [Streptomyces coeruleorubidus]WDV56901.1 DUF397 domain-containing protein [Streptomyces coeruleorubidus]
MAPDTPGVVPIRDSKTPDSPILLVTRSAWSAFLAGVC